MPPNSKMWALGVSPPPRVQRMQVREWMQAGYGVFYGDGSDRNFAACVPVVERQSVGRGELRGVLHALLQRKPGERLVVVLDSLYVYKGIMEWSPKWRRHGWRTSSGEVGHRDLWEQILWERERAGLALQIHWVPSHLGVEGNVGADQLAEQGRQSHPNNFQRLPKRPQAEPQWEALGLEEMCSDPGEAQDSGRSSYQGTMCSESWSSGEWGSSSGCSTTVSDSRRLSSGSGDSGFSTDINDTRRTKMGRVREGRDNQEGLQRSLRACAEQSGQCCD